MRKFFYPENIAVIGASDNKEKVGYALMKNLLKFKGAIIPINPNHKKIMGIRAYASVLDFKKKIDLAVIAIPSKFVFQALTECGKKGIREVIVISAGFSEIGNTRLEKKLISISKKYKINLLGPNCFGVCNPSAFLDTTFALKTPKKGKIAFISQSGAIWSYISDFSLLPKQSFGFSGFVSLGNMAGASFSEFIKYFALDKKTKAIVLYIEKLKDGRKFLTAAKHCKKLIYAVKSGKSREGSKAAVSHTGSLATDYEIYRGAFKQAGVILCDSLLEAFGKASGKKLIKAKKDIQRKETRIGIGKSAVIITNAGGAGALTADYCSEAGIKVIGPFDILGTALAKDYRKALRNFGRKAKTIIVLLTPQYMTEIKETARAIIDSKKKLKRQIIACFLGGESMSEAKKILGKKGIKCFNNLEEFKRNIYIL